MRREKSGHESVANAKKLWYPSLSPANVKMLRIRELEPDLFSSDNEVEYVFFDEPIDGIGVLAARTNESQLAKKSFKEPIKQILHQHIKKKKEYAAPKNVRFGKREPVRESIVLAPLLVILFVAPETAMLDANLSTAKKSVEKKRHPWVVNVLKKSVGAITITKRILDLKVSLTVCELLPFAPAVEKQLKKTIFKDEAVQFRINTLKSAEVWKASTPYF